MRMRRNGWGSGAEEVWDYNCIIIIIIHIKRKWAGRLAKHGQSAHQLRMLFLLQPMCWQIGVAIVVIEDDFQLYDNTILALNHLYIPSDMCCLLILCREETIKGAEGPNKVSRSIKERTKGWHDKRMRKEYNLGDKMFMNSSSKESFKQEEKTATSHLPFVTWCHHTSMMKVTS